MITSEQVIKRGRWKIKKLRRLVDDSQGALSVENKREAEVVDEWYVLKRADDTSAAISIPFDEVKASGSHVQLIRNDQQCATLSEVADGMNTYKEETDFPEDVFRKLKEIGPW